MAKLVEIIGVAHNPHYPRRMANPTEEDPAMLAIRDSYAAMRTKMTEARPDVLLVVGNDHLNKLFMDNMPAFLVCKPFIASGPPRWEREGGIPHVDATVHRDLARGIVQRGFDHGVDFSFSDEVQIDHAITIPIHYVSPDPEHLPVVPIMTNVMTPPMPPAKRFFEVGQAIRSIIDEWPEDIRVGVAASGHLAVEIGGPKGRGASPDIDFDHEAVDIIGRGDIDALMRHASFERMAQAGNFTPGFLNFVMLVGMSGGLPASQSDLIVCKGSNPAPFFTWDLHKG